MPALADTAYCVRVSTNGSRSGLCQQTCGAKHLSRVNPHMEAVNFCDYLWASSFQCANLVVDSIGGFGVLAQEGG